MDLSWQDVHWADPDGGEVIFHAVIPTVVYPRALRIREKWDGLCLLTSSSEVAIWDEEDKYEREDPGVNLESALLGGGITGIYLDELTQLNHLSVGRFPDPEPRRLQRLAFLHDRPVYFAEPDMDDDDWSQHLTDEASEMTKFRRLFSMIRVGGSWRKKFKSVKKHGKMPEHSDDPGFLVASVLSSTWWLMLQDRSSEELNQARDRRFAQRIRGALANLRTMHGSNAKLLIPVNHIWRTTLLDELNQHPKPEEVSFLNANSGVSEEE